MLVPGNLGSSNKELITFKWKNDLNLHRLLRADSQNAIFEVLKF
jgi:hypothetical protein